MTYKTFKIKAAFTYFALLGVSLVASFFHGDDTRGIFDTLYHWVFNPVLMFAVAFALIGGVEYFLDKHILEKHGINERVNKLLNKLDAIYAKADKKKKSVDK